MVITEANKLDWILLMAGQFFPLRHIRTKKGWSLFGERDGGAGVPANQLLKEDGISFILKEDGFTILLET